MRCERDPCRARARVGGASTEAPRFPAPGRVPDRHRRHHSITRSRSNVACSSICERCPIDRKSVAPRSDGDVVQRPPGGSGVRRPGHWQTRAARDHRALPPGQLLPLPEGRTSPSPTPLPSLVGADELGHSWVGFRRISLETSCVGLGWVGLGQVGLVKSDP